MRFLENYWFKFQVSSTQKMFVRSVQLAAFITFMWLTCDQIGEVQSTSAATDLQALVRKEIEEDLEEMKNQTKDTYKIAGPIQIGDLQTEKDGRKLHVAMFKIENTRTKVTIILFTLSLKRIFVRRVVCKGFLRKTFSSTFRV